MPNPFSTQAHQPTAQPATAETGPAVDANASYETTAATEQANEEETVVVKCPSMVSVLKSRDGNFPDVTPQGTEMTKTEATAAKQAAKAVRVKLTTNRGSK